LALDVFSKVTPSRWWVPHKEGMEDGSQCRILMQVRFGTEVEYIAQKYTGVSNPIVHVEQCRNIWRSISNKEWMHKFIHTQDTIPKNWYMELEMDRETIN
jgi:hypothetical protein